MMYAFPILIAAMLGFIFFSAAYRLRRDRLAVARANRRVDPRPWRRRA